MAAFNLDELEIPSLGMDTDTVPRLLNSRKAPLLQNFLLDRPGVLPMRGPICEGTTWDLGASIGVLGVWQFDDKLLVSRNVADATRTRDYWVTPYRKSTVTQLRQAQANLQHIDLNTGTLTTFNLGGPVLGLLRSSVRLGQYVYGYAYTNGTFLQDGNYYQQASLVHWDGSNAAGGLAGYSSNAPLHAQDIAYHYNRLFVLSGVPVGGTRIQFNSLYWSDPIASDGSLLPSAQSAWQDDVSGLANQLVVGSDTPHDFGVALAHVGAGLCILKRHSVYMLNGTSPSNFSIKQVSNEVGCIDPRSVVEYEDGVFFMSERGFMFFDGVAVRSVSSGLESTLVANALKQVGSRGVDGGYCRATLLDRGYILVTTGVMDGATLTSTADTEAWLFHVRSGAWVQLSSAALPSILHAGRALTHTWLMTDQKLIKANYLFNPNAAPAGTRGIDSIDNGTTKFLIPSRWTTRALTLSTPSHISQLHRIIVDYYWSLSNGGWQVAANTRGATGAVTNTSVLAAPTTIAPATLPTRGAIDIANETDEMYLDITANSSAPATFSAAELHRVMVESQPAAPVRGVL